MTPGNDPVSAFPDRKKPSYGKYNFGAEVYLLVPVLRAWHSGALGMVLWFPLIVTRFLPGVSCQRLISPIAMRR